MTRVIGPPKSRRRRWTFIWCLVVALGVGAFYISGAQAVHDFSDGMQLDGDVSHNCPATGSAICFSTQQDWATIFTTSDDATAGTETVSPNGSVVGATGSPFTKATFTRDFESGSSCTLNSLGTKFCTGDDSTFATGSKDTLDIINGGWQCNHDNNVNSKIDIMNAYAASYTIPTGRANAGDKVLYFGLEKNKDNGTNDVGFWFLQGDADCSAPSGHVNWTGSGHTVGDVLVVSEFTNGGGVSNITAYRWVGGSNPLVQIASASGNGGDCKTALGGDVLCATTNATSSPAFNGNITTPWLTADATLGVGNTVVPPDFFEGGIDITRAFATSGGGAAPTCFNTFVGDTRSSTALTATLFDYARGRLGECSSGTSTTPVDATDTSKPPATSIPADPADAKVTVKDKTVITVNGINTFSGSISWHICGATDPTSTATCDSGGVDLGSTNITTAGTYYSPTATVTAAGRYCFRAEFSGDSSAGVPSSSDHSSGECFTVAPVTPTISTQAVASPVDFGNAVQDNATLSGTAHKPGTGGPTGATPAGSINPTTLGGDATGSITFTLYKSDCTTLATGTGTNPQTVSVSGDGTYGPVSFTPDAPGTYYWDATYPGDSPNTKAATNTTACPNDSEKVVVRTIPSSITTTQKVFPQDSATITDTVSGNNLPAGGTVVFYLYGAGGGNTALQNCQAHGTTVGSGGLLFTRTISPAVPVGGAHSITVDTNNQTTVAVNANATVYWRVTYATGDTAHTGIQSDCVENTAVTFGNDSGPGTAFP